MIPVRLPSNQRQYDEYWSGDSAFKQPDSSDIESLKAHWLVVKRCRETGDWSELIVDGRQPTKFVMEPLGAEQFRWLVDRLNVTNDLLVGDAVAASLCFRCAIRAVHNLPVEYKVKFVDHPHLGRIADVEIVEMLDAHHKSIVSELGMAAFVRARDLNPL